jgi:hypothetical protein
VPSARIAILSVILAGCGRLGGSPPVQPSPSTTAAPVVGPAPSKAGSVRPRAERLALEVREDDTRFRELVADAALVAQAQRAEWKTTQIEQEFKKDKRFHGGLATQFVGLPSAEKKALLAWLASNPLRDRDQELVARVTLGDARALDEVLAALLKAPTERLKNLVWYLGWFDWSTIPGLHARRAEVLLPLLDHPDRFVVARTGMALERYEQGFWWDEVRRRLLDRRYPHKSSLVGVARKADAPDLARVLATAMAHRGTDEKPDLFVYALDELAKRGGASGRQAEEALFAAVEAESPQALAGVYSPLLTRNPQRTLPIAERYLFHVTAHPTATPGNADAFVLREWVRRRGKNQLARVRSWTSHPTLGRPALEALTELAVGSGDEQLVELWRTYASTRRDPRVYDAVAAIGGETAKAAALELWQRAGGSSGRDVGLWWRLKDIDLQESLRICVRHGLLPSMPDPNVVRRGAEEHERFASPFAQWISVMRMAGRAAFFDVETSTFPNRHDELILDELAKGGGGVFVPTKAVEVWRAERDSYDVAFEHRGRWYHFVAEALGDWYDVRSVMAAVNRALADSGAPERFHSLDAGGQAAFLVLAKPESLAAAAQELRLPLGDDPDRPRQLGKAFEDEAARRLGLREGTTRQ